MPRAVFWNVDTTNANDWRDDARCFKAGMLVDILPTGASLGKDGDKDARFTAIDLPDTKEVIDELQLLLSSPLDKGELEAEVVGPRAHKVNVSVLRKGVELSEIILSKNATEAIAPPDEIKWQLP